MVDQKIEARVQHQLAQTPEAQHLLRQRAIRRTISVLALLAATGLFLARLLPLLVALGLYGIATLVGFTRVYLGVHYSRDVVAGAILGLIWGGLGVVLAPYL